MSTIGRIKAQLQNDQAAQATESPEALVDAVTAEACAAAEHARLEHAYHTANAALRAATTELNAAQTRVSDISTRLAAANTVREGAAATLRRIDDMDVHAVSAYDAAPGLSVIDWSKPIVLRPPTEVSFHTHPIRLYHAPSGLYFPQWHGISFAPLHMRAVIYTTSYGSSVNVYAPRANSSLPSRTFLRSANCYHPHISNTGTACLGDYAHQLLRAMQDLDSAAVLWLLCSFITSYNPDSPYYRLESALRDWVCDGLLPCGQMIPWLSYLCRVCQKPAQACTCELVLTRTCPGCATPLNELPVGSTRTAFEEPCGWCSTCCARYHTFDLDLFNASTGLNGSGCTL